MDEIEQELLLLINQQKENLLKLAEQWIPNITHDDLLQPFDYPILENNPLFRYEEGILAGMTSALYTFYHAKRISKEL